MESFAELAKLVASYEIADFVPYDATAWQSLYAQYLSTNLLHVTALAAVLLVLQFRASGSARPGRMGACFLILLAGAWLFLGVRFHGQWHQQYNWAALYWEIAFVAQAAGLCVLAAWLFCRPSSLAWRAGFGIQWLLVLPWLIPPLSGFLAGTRSVHELETAGLAPDPTAWLTLLVLMLLHHPYSSLPAGNRRSAAAIVGVGILITVLLIVPVCSLLLSAIAASVTGATDLLIVNMAVLVSVVAILVGGVTRYTAGNRHNP